MLVRIYELNFTMDDDTGMDKATFLKGYEFKNIDKIVKFVKCMKGKDLRIGNIWYTIDDFVWTFPEEHDNIPTFDIYVYSY